MEIRELIDKFSGTKEDQEKAIFSTLFILGNKLQTIFDNHIPEISLKQFMLLTMVRQAEKSLTFTQLGQLLGCSRQNIKKLASILEKKGYVTIRKSEADSRALSICPTLKLNDFFENVFATYRKELGYLFEVYTEEEVGLLFSLFMKMYEGIDNLERSVGDK